jgi:hypothetical protein
MRKLLSAGVLAAAVTAATVFPAIAANAAPADDDENYSWNLEEDYFHLADCHDAGDEGVALGDWEQYKCVFETVPGKWNLYTLSADDDDDDDDGGEG